ncbi:MAG TPA: 5-formyltetrahydrofolate cyclo-ligase, partial [Burkholderiales bacterium]|nr:5-formyltetrahydrofolate cyclo-ligase [Burkholderiales bacterium]
MKSKNELRKIITAQCLNFDSLYYENAAKLLLQMAKPLLLSANKIAIYHANINEIKLDFLIDFAIKQGKKLFQPISYYNSKIMRFNGYDKNNSKIFYSNNYELKDEIQWYNLDLIFLPLIAIDKLG